MSLSFLLSSDDIRVSLTTSKFCQKIDGQEDDQNIFVKMNIPVCVSESFLGIISTDVEFLEHLHSQIAKKIAKEVFVDLSKNYVFIGEDHNNETTGLIIYTAEKMNVYEIEFFKRWEKTHCLMLEYQVFDANKKALFVVKGFWDKHFWRHLEIFPSTKIEIAIPEYDNNSTN
jgi:hypothetical protein